MVARLLASGQMTSQEIALAESAQAALGALSGESVPFYVSYRVRLALK